MSFKLFAKAGNSSNFETIFTSWKQSFANVTENWLIFLIHSIAKWESISPNEVVTDSFLYFSLSLNHQNPRMCYKMARIVFLIFQDPSVKHHLPGINGAISAASNRVLSILWVIEICASTQSNDIVSVNLRLFLGSISKLLDILLFLLIQIYHKIYVNWWFFISGELL